MRVDKHLYHDQQASHRIVYGNDWMGCTSYSQHVRQEKPGFTKKYNLDKLVYYEEFSEVLDAINREKQIKRWSRKKKEALIATKNPEWKNLLLEI